MSVSDTVQLQKSCDLCDSVKLLSTLTKSVLAQYRLIDFAALKKMLLKSKVQLSSVSDSSMPANCIHRKALLSSPKDGIKFTDGSSKILSADFVTEALILSDLFQLNELTAAELLLFGEAQLPRYPGWTRGLVAVILYYDSKLSLINCLKMITKAISGATWCADLNPEVQTFLNGFVDDLVNDGLIEKILSTLCTFEPSAQFEKLRAQKALGDFKHRQIVSQLLENIISGLSESVYNIGCQMSLSIQDSTKVINFLKAVDDRLMEENGTVIREMWINLIFSCIFAFDECQNENFLLSINQVLANNSPIQEGLNQNRNFQTVFSFLYFHWSVRLRKMSSRVLSDTISSLQEEDEWFLERAVAAEVFTNLQFMVANTNFGEDEFKVMKLHQILTDFILHFPLTMRDLRNHGDEVARTVGAYLEEGLSPPSDLAYDYENFLKFMGQFYQNEKLKLCDEFWRIDSCGVLISPTKALAEMQKSLALNKFCLSAIDYIPPLLYVPVVTMLTGISSSEEAASSCFQLLVTASQNPAQTTVSLDHFFNALQLYYSNLRQERPNFKGAIAEYKPAASAVKSQNSQISPFETQGLESMLFLIANLCENCPEIVPLVVENSRWKAIYTFFGLITCRIQMSLKAKCMHVLGVFATNPKFAPSLWASVEKYGLIDLSPNPSRLTNTGIIQELEEFESKVGTYELSCSFVAFVNKILKFCPSHFNLELLVSYLIEKLLNKFNVRNYVDPKSMYAVATGVLDVILTSVESMTAHVQSFADKQYSLSMQLASQLFKDSTLTKKLFFIIDKTAQKVKDFSCKDTESTALVQLCEKCLDVLIRALEIQPLFFNAIREAPDNQIYTPMDSLLQCLNTTNSLHDHLHNVIKIISFSGSNEKLTSLVRKCTQLLSLHAKLSLNQSRSFKYVLSDCSISQWITQSFVDIIENCQQEYESAANLLEYVLCLLDFPNKTVAHLVLSAGTSKSQTASKLTLNSPRNCLHAVTYVLDEIVQSEQIATHEIASLICLGYKIIFKMCVGQENSMSTFRFLQNLDWFLCRHLNELNRVLNDTEIDTVKPLLNHSFSWIMKTFALDFRNCCVQNKERQISRLVATLAEVGSSQTRQFMEASFMPSASGFSTGLTSVMHDFTMGTAQLETGFNRPWFLQVISSFNFEASMEHELQVTYFDTETVSRAFSTCESYLASKTPYSTSTHTGTDTSLTYFDVKSLHSVLSHELNFQSMTPGQKEAALQEVEEILTFAGRENYRKDEYMSRLTLLNSWCQLFEIWLLFSPSEILTSTDKRNLIICVLETLCSCLNLDDLVPEFGKPMTNCILNILSYLKNHLDESKRSNHTEFLAMGSVAELNPSVLENLIKFYIRGCSAGRENLCVNTLSAMLTYLRLFALDGEEKNCNTELFRYRTNNWSYISQYGDQFFRRLFSESSLGHVVQRTLALSLFCEVIDHDVNQVVPRLMSKDGFLYQVIGEFATDNVALIDALQSPGEFNALYLTNSSKFCLISKLAQTTTGASSLLQSDFFQILSNFTFVDARPITSKVMLEPVQNKMRTKFLSDQLASYRQIFMPLMECCHNILSTLTVTHEDAVNLVFHFILSHLDVFIDILAPDFSKINLEDLLEIKAVCGLISSAALKGSADYNNVLVQTTGSNLLENMRKIHLQLLKCLSTFGDLRNWEIVVNSVETVQEKENLRANLIDILSYLLSYASGHALSTQDVKGVDFGGSSIKTCEILFFPSVIAPNDSSIETSKGLNDYCNMGVLYRLMLQILGEMSTLLEEQKDFENLFRQERYSDKEILLYGGLTPDQAKEETSFHLQTTPKVKSNLAKLKLIKYKQIKSLYRVMEMLVFVVAHHVNYYFTNFSTGSFEKGRSNFKEVRRIIASKGASCKGGPDTKRYGLTQRNTMIEDCPEEKLAQIRDFQFETVQTLPSELLTRLLKLDITIQREIFYSMDKGQLQNFNGSFQVQTSNYISSVALTVLTCIGFIMYIFLYYRLSCNISSCTSCLCVSHVY